MMPRTSGSGVDRRVVAIMLTVGATALAPRVMHAQARDGGGLSLRAVIDSAIARAPGLVFARLQVERSRGDVELAGGQFDTHLRTFIASSDSRAMQADAATTFSPLNARTVDYGVSQEKVLRSGIILRPGITATRATVSGQPVAPSAATMFSVVLPMARGRGETAVGASERAAENSFAADELDLRQSAAQSVATAALAYWDYLAAQRRMEAIEESERRTTRLAADTKLLIAADERPASDLGQVSANLAGKHAARFAAEQRVVEARQQLGLAIGLDPVAIDALPMPVTEFPSALAGVAGPADSRVVEMALQQRTDLTAATYRQTATRDLVSGARDNLRPRFDLEVGVGYTGIDRGGNLGQLFSPLYRNVAGLSSSIQFTFELPGANNSARGLVRMRDAATQEAAQQRAMLSREISSSALVAVQAVRRGQLSLASAIEAVALSRTAVESESKRFHLGVTTIFDQIFAEDALTNALLAQIDAQSRLAGAITRLRLVTGTLVQQHARSFSTSEAALLSAADIAREP
jgi:outer membrane protein